MTDLYTNLTNNPIGKLVAKNVGLPQPVPLDRYSPGDPVVRGTVLLGAAPGGRLARPLADALASAGADTASSLDGDVRSALGAAGLDAAVFGAETADESQRFKALVFDATGIKDIGALSQLHAFFSPTYRRVERSGRVVVLGTPPEAAGGVKEATAQRALEGFTRSLGKEIRKGSAVNLVYVEPGAEQRLEATLRFFLSPRSAYVSAQVVRVGAGTSTTPADWEQPLDGKVAVVTGASRGIGAAIASVLARDGAHVVGVDVPPLEEDLRRVVDELDGSAFTADITEAGTPKALAAHLRSEHGGVDVVVHNAGITRDKTLGRMTDELWSQVLDVNLGAVARLNDALLSGKGLLNRDARIVGVSSISGIAGNAGQTNYATSKAGVIGYVQAMAPVLAERAMTINAVAPGFIETQMTAAMPIATREAGRRMNSMSQGGLPVDVAEAVAWFASPGSGGVTGNVVRVCGQSLLGA